MISISKREILEYCYSSRSSDGQLDDAHALQECTTFFNGVHQLVCPNEVRRGKVGRESVQMGYKRGSPFLLTKTDNA